MDLDQLRHDGYTVAEQVVGPELVDAVVAAVRERSDGTAGMVPIWGHQALWNVRQHPAVHAVFAAALGTEALWVSMDRVSIKAPGEPALRIHWDVPPDSDGPRVLQGVVALTDAPAGAGGFCGVPELFRDRAGWLARHPGAPAWDIDLEGHAPTPVPVHAGDLIVFDALLPHGNEANGAATPRLAQYVTMREPDAWGATAAGRVGLYEERRSGFGEYADIVEPWPPATLTPLGRRLLGLDAWPTAARRP